MVGSGDCLLVIVRSHRHRFCFWPLHCYIAMWGQLFTLVTHVLSPFDITAPCGLRGCKNRPTPFPGQMSYKATKPGFSVLYLSMSYCNVVY